MATAPPITMAAAEVAAPFDPRAVSSTGSKTAFYLLLTYFRQTNAEGLRIRDRLVRALDQAKSGLQPGCATALKETQQVIRHEFAEAQARTAFVDQVRSLDPETEAWYAREIVQVRNAWDDLEQVWAADVTGQEPLADLVARAQRSVEILDQLIFVCASQTIPDELDNYLANYRIGTCLDFLSTFKDQLPDEASTRKLLENLAPQSVLVPGLIDVRNARVIKADRRPWRQVVSLMVVLATAALGFLVAGAVVHLGTWKMFGLTGWPLDPSKWEPLNGAYLMVLLGVLGHWVLDRVKLNRSGSDVTPFSEWLMWIHVNEVPITVRILSIWLLIALGIAFKMFEITAAIQPVTFFTAGYFMDSTFDALIGRFNTFISANDPSKAKAPAQTGGGR